MDEQHPSTVATMYISGIGVITVTARPGPGPTGSAPEVTCELSVDRRGSGAQVVSDQASAGNRTIAYSDGILVHTRSAA
jgi:hypothetical protein